MGFDLAGPAPRPRRLVEAMTRKLSGVVSGFRMHSGYLGQRRSAYNHWADRSRYTADNLREIRRRKGVGRPPAIGNSRQGWAAKDYRSYLMSCAGFDSPNLAEWHRKPRPKDRKAA